MSIAAVWDRLPQPGVAEFFLLSACYTLHPVGNESRRPVPFPDQFEPLLPGQARQERLLAKAHDPARAATRLAGLPIAPGLRGLLRGMNSYYSNRIEGQHARPLEIEPVLAHRFSDDRELAARQRLAIAHIDAETASEQAYVGDDGARRL